MHFCLVLGTYYNVQCHVFFQHTFSQPEVTPTHGPYICTSNVTSKMSSSLVLLLCIPLDSVCVCVPSCCAASLHSVVLADKYDNNLIRSQEYILSIELCAWLNSVDPQCCSGRQYLLVLDLFGSVTQSKKV